MLVGGRGSCELKSELGSGMDTTPLMIMNINMDSTAHIITAGWIGLVACQSVGF